MRWTRKRIIFLAVAVVILGIGAFLGFRFVRGLLEMRANRGSVLVGQFAVKLEEYRRETGDYPHTPAEAFELAKARIRGGVEIALRHDGTIRMKSQRSTVDVTYVYSGPDNPPIVGHKWPYLGWW